MRHILLFLALFPSISSAELFYYSNSIEGIQPGKTTYEEVVARKGKPGNETIRPFGTKLEYDDMVVTFSRSRHLVNTVIIKSLSFRDLNGISIGDKFEKVTSLDRCVLGNKRYVTELNNGLSYWFENGRVTKIVYASAAEIHKDAVLKAGYKISNKCDSVLSSSS